jgi:chemotaxis protein methyltransferase CheR
MCLKEFASVLAGWRVEIVATDLSQAVLKIQGWNLQPVRGPARIADQMLVKHFTQIGELWQLNADIRVHGSHRQLNLLQDFLILERST